MVSQQLDTQAILQSLDAAKNQIRVLFAAHREALDELQHGCTHPEVLACTWGSGMLRKADYICPACGLESTGKLWHMPSPDSPFLGSTKTQVDSSTLLAVRKRFAPLVA